MTWISSATPTLSILKFEVYSSSDSLWIFSCVPRTPTPAPNLYVEILNHSTADPIGRGD